MFSMFVVTFHQYKFVGGENDAINEMQHQIFIVVNIIDLKSRNKQLIFISLGQIVPYTFIPCKAHTLRCITKHTHSKLAD